MQVGHAPKSAHSQPIGQWPHAESPHLLCATAPRGRPEAARYDSARTVQVPPLALAPSLSHRGIEFPQVCSPVCETPCPVRRTTTATVWL